MTADVRCCPFCAMPPMLVYVPSFDEDTKWIAQCNPCRVMMEDATFSGLMRKWNRRDGVDERRYHQGSVAKQSEGTRAGDRPAKRGRAAALPKPKRSVMRKRE